MRLSRAKSRLENTSKSSARKIPASFEAPPRARARCNDTRLSTLTPSQVDRRRSWARALAFHRSFRSIVDGTASSPRSWAVDAHPNRREIVARSRLWRFPHRWKSPTRRHECASSLRLRVVAESRTELARRTSPARDSLRRRTRTILRPSSPALPRAETRARLARSSDTRRTRASSSERRIPRTHHRKSRTIP